MAERRNTNLCEKCGNRLHLGAKFCGSCGATILSPPPQAEQVIPRQEAASHAPSRGRTLLWIVGGGLILLLVLGVGISALMPTSDRRIEISSDVYSEIPEGWAVATSGRADSVSKELVREGFENQKLEDFGGSTETSSAEESISAYESSCERAADNVPSARQQSRLS